MYLSNWKEPHFENHQVRDIECQCGWSSVSEETAGRSGGLRSRWRLDHVGLCNTKEFGFSSEGTWKPYVFGKVFSRKLT